MYDRATTTPHSFFRTHPHPLQPLQEFAPATLFVQKILGKKVFSELTPDPSLIKVIAVGMDYYGREGRYDFNSLMTIA